MGVYVWGYVGACVHIHVGEDTHVCPDAMHVHMVVEAREEPQVSVPLVPPTFLCGPGSFNNPEPKSRLDYLVCEPQGPTCVRFSSTGIISMHHTTVACFILT